MGGERTLEDGEYSLAAQIAVAAGMAVVGGERTLEGGEYSLVVQIAVAVVVGLAADMVETGVEAEAEAEVEF